MRKISIIIGIFILLCLIYCNFAVAEPVTTHGIEHSLLQQVVVEPLLGKNLWRQVSIMDSNDKMAIPFFYNWHVYDKYDAPYPLGCGPLAVAQVMRFFEHPKTQLTSSAPEFEPLISKDFFVIINSKEISTKIIGGSGQYGSYNWGLMDINPLPEYYQILSKDSPASPSSNSDPNTPQAKTRNETSSLLYDLGALMHVNYAMSGTGASDGKYFEDSASCTALKKYLGYSSAQHRYFRINESIQNVLKSNLMIRHPVIMGCASQLPNEQNMAEPIRSNHFFVVDGYGYINSGDRTEQTAYYHLNLGWGEGGYKDLWYPLSNFPVIVFVN